MFDIICETSYYWNEILFINYTADFTLCMNECIQWNIRNPQKCVSVTWGYAPMVYIVQPEEVNVGFSGVP